MITNVKEINNNDNNNNNNKKELKKNTSLKVIKSLPLRLAQYGMCYLL